MTPVLIAEVDYDAWPPVKTAGIQSLTQLPPQ
jgi:hypothetical protein